MSQSIAQPLPASASGRIAALTYGTLAYIAFFGTFLYAIGFVTNLVVPKSIDSGAAGPLATALLVNAGLLAVFAAQHMIMARQWFKRRWTKIVPPAVERSTFVVATCLALNLMYWQWRPIPGVVWDVTNPVGAALLQAAGWAGWALVLVATFLIDHFDLFGLRQVIRYALGKQHAEPEFKVVSFYKYVRHPLYLGFMLAFWCTPTMTVGHLFFAVMTTAFMMIASRFEERDLVRMHPQYEDYRRRVPAILPNPARKY